MIRKQLLFFIFFINGVFVNASDYIIITDIIISGNKRTRSEVILREFTFEKGDTILRGNFRAQVQKTCDNIYNLHLFNFVEADTSFTDSVYAVIKINVLERWFIWPVPILEYAGRNLGAWLYEGHWDRINYGLFLVVANVRGRNETFMLKIRPGWREQYGFLYSIPALNKKKTLGLEFSYSTFRQKIFLLNTIDNKPFYHVSDDYCYFQNRAIASFVYRPSLYFFHYFILTYNDFRISDHAYSENSIYLAPGKKQTSFMSFSYEPQLEKRNIVAYPTKGYFTGLRFQNTGMGLFDRDINVWQFGALASYYQPAGERFFFATGLDAAFHTNEHESFLFDQAIGYNNYIRGFELYTINGNAYWLQKFSVNYNLVKTRVKTFTKKEKYQKFLKLHYAMYLSAFTDMGYVHTDFKTQTYQNRYLNGYGLGLDFVTYYDWVFRLEYSVNMFGENRIYLHFQAPF